MKNFLLLSVILSQIYGCAADLQPYPRHRELFPDGSSLWEVRIGRGSSQLFAGLLALNQKKEGLEAVLLDSTGIKLLEEKIYSSGEIEVVSVLPAVRNRRLGQLLGGGLFRLFFTPPGLTDESCFREGFFALCFGIEEEGQLVKFRRLGPFVLWSGDYSIRNYDSVSAVTGARLKGGWLVPYLKLEKIGGDL